MTETGITMQEAKAIIVGKGWNEEVIDEAVARYTLRIRDLNTIEADYRRGNATADNVHSAAAVAEGACLGIEEWDYQNLAHRVWRPENLIEWLR